MMSVLVFVLLAGVFHFPKTCCAPAGNNSDNNNGNHYDHYGNHYYYHDYDHHDANKHNGHHDYEGGDDLFGHVKTNLSDHPDDHVYHDLYHYGMSHHEHMENDTNTGGGGGFINNIKKIFKNDADTVSISTMTSLLSCAVAATFVYNP